MRGWRNKLLVLEVKREAVGAPRDAKILLL